jgi:DNA sulfur modification protein DndD
MLLSKLKMDNFRQFYGETTFSFSTNKKKNITLVHGENGVGKTTILNAILWCLFGKLTVDFEEKDKLICNEAEKEGIESCTVEVEFDYEDDIYRAQRIFEKGVRKTKFSIHKIDKDGVSIDISNPKAFMNSVLPNDMAEYFFFHGEGISNINSRSSGDSFRKAIRNILGFTFAEAAISDLKYVRKKWNDVLADLSSGKKELTKALNEKKEYFEYKDKFETEISLKRNEESSLQKDLDEIRKKIESFGNIDAARIQKEINSKEKDQKIYESKIESLNIDKQSLIHKYGWAIVGFGLANKGLDFIDESALKGKIPSPYDETLVKDLLSQNECICGRELIKDSAPYKKVLSMIQTANTGLISQRLSKSRAVAGKAKGIALEFLGAVDKIETELDVQHKRLGSIISEIKELNKEIDEIPVTEISKLRKEYQTANEMVSKINQEIGEKVQKVKLIDHELKQLDSIIKKETHTDDRFARLQACELILESMILKCTLYLESYENEARESISSIVNEILDEFSRKEYQVLLTKNFDFNMIRADGTVVGKSKGENLLLNLAFVSSLIKIARERIEAKSDILISGTVAPFVIDAPFGELDTTYRTATSKFLPDNSQQLILLLSSSHWKDEVEESIRGRIGSEYALISHKTGPIGKKPKDMIEIKGRKIQQSLYEEDIEYTSVEVI